MKVVQSPVVSGVAVASNKQGEFTGSLKRVEVYVNKTLSKIPSGV